MQEKLAFTISSNDCISRLLVDFISNINLRAEEINELFIKYLKNPSLDEKFFAWLHYMDLHYPWFPPKDYLPEGISEHDVIRFNLSKDRKRPIAKVLYEARSL